MGHRAGANAGALLPQEGNENGATIIGGHDEHRRKPAAMKPRAIKSGGYLVSTLSIVLLGIVSWKNASHDPALMICLIVGMAASALGMLLRWLSYEIEERSGSEAKQPSANPAKR